MWFAPAPCRRRLEGDDVGSDGDDVHLGNSVSEKAPKGEKSPPRARRRNAREPNEAVGAALRSVYQRAASEDVPDDLLDLLRKLD